MGFIETNFVGRRTVVELYEKKVYPDLQVSGKRRLL
tara:strand:- start:9364 stop:9471 length:108 start_codon:yes stop_codon:yes gene_type:complete